MQLILHAGMPKAGSSALQQWLHSNRETLQDQGVVYPRSPIISKNHHVMLPCCLENEQLPRYVQYRAAKRGKNIRRTFLRWKADLERLIEQRPRAVILSSEAVFVLDRLRGEEAYIDLGNMLRSLFSDIRVVLYVRKPSKFFLSSTQQGIKASHRVRQPSAVEYRKPVELIESNIASVVDVYSYDDVQTTHRGLIEHFGSMYDPAIERLAREEPSEKQNRSLSAEAISIMRVYREGLHKDRQNVFTDDTSDILKALTKADQEVGGYRAPELYPAVAKEIDESSVDLLWLQGRFGIEFDGIDYASIEPRESLMRPRTLEQICPVSLERRDEVMSRTMFYLWQGTTGQTTHLDGRAEGRRRYGMIEKIARWAVNR